MWKIWASIPFLVTCTFALLNDDIALHFQSVLSNGSGVYVPKDTNWETETVQRWSMWNHPTIAVSVKPKTTEDVQKVIQYVLQNKISFLTTGGGHGYSGSISAMNGIQIDMGNFNGVSVDPEKNLLTIGGSVRFRDMMSLVHGTGKAIVVGACSCVGMTGATLGGGIGFYSGLYGAISDSLVSVEMVTGTGELITVSNTSHADLYWGIQGAGFNFGSIISSTYRIYDYVNGGRLMNADMLIPVSQNGSVWKILRTFFENQPRELSIAIGLLFDARSAQVMMAVNTIYAGTVDDGTRLIKPFLDLHPIATNISNLPWSEVPDSALFGGIAANCQFHPYYVPYASNLHDIDIKTMVEVVKYINNTMPRQPALQASLVTFTQYSAWGFNQHGLNSSAFPYRNQVTFAQVDGIASTSEDVPAVDQFGKSVRQLLQGGKTSQPVYVHFAHGDEEPTAWYTDEKLPHLKELKKRYDPEQMFSWYNPIR